MARCLSVAGMVLLLACHAWAYTVVQTASHGGGPGTTNPVTMSSTTSGNLLVCGGVASGTVTLTCSDNQSGTWVTPAATNFNSAAGTIGACYSINNGGSITSITATWSASVNSQVVCREYNTSPNVTAFDQEATDSNDSSSTLTAGPTSTTAVATELVVGFVQAIKAFASPPQFTVGAGFGNYNETAFVSGGGVDDFIGIEDESLSSTGTPSATFGNSNGDNANAVVLTFEIGSGGGGGPNHNGLVTHGAG